jgi:hypothetical protein
MRWCLVVLDDPEFSRQLGRIKHLDLNATSGAVRTSAGTIGYIVWSLSSGRNHIVDYEHTLNPFSDKTLALISDVAEQSSLDC